MAGTGAGGGRQQRQAIHIGDAVEIVEKANQRTGKRTTGIVAEILTSSATHPHGIKVRLRSGAVGRVQTVLSPGTGSAPEDPKKRLQSDDTR
jgi:uncharacterized repeat protein (TIGR03833 family)